MEGDTGVERSGVPRGDITALSPRPRGSGRLCILGGATTTRGSRWMGAEMKGASSPSRRRDPCRLVCGDERGDARGDALGEARADLLLLVRVPGGSLGAGPSGMVGSQEARRHKALASSFNSIPRATAGRDKDGPTGHPPAVPSDPRRCTPAPDPDPSSMVMGGQQPPHPPPSYPLSQPPVHRCPRAHWHRPRGCTSSALGLTLHSTRSHRQSPRAPSTSSASPCCSERCFMKGAATQAPLPTRLSCAR